MKTVTMPKKNDLTIRLEAILPRGIKLNARHNGRVFSDKRTKRQKTRSSRCRSALKDW